MDFPLLPDIVKIFGLSICVLLFCHRIHLPNVVGFLVTGMLCGPHALGLIQDEAEVQILAQLGIILLLFTVGMEFSFKRILEYRRYFFIGGMLQVGLTVLAAFVISLFLDGHWGRSLFFGFLISLSSTAIVLRVLDDKHETDTPYGRVIVGIMIFQDIVAIPMMLLIPFLGGVEQAMSLEVVYSVGKGLVVLCVVLFSADKLVPKVMHLIAKTRSRELFLLSVLTVCFAVAWVTSSVGLSLSLGAFLAGLIISESDYRTEAIGDILPFQDIFTSFFFVSIGMLLDLHFVVQQPFTILWVTVAILAIKALLAGGTAIVLGMPLRAVVLSAIALCQIGEFSLVLAKSGSAYDLTTEYQYQLFLAVSLLGMALTPSLMAFSPRLAEILLRLPIPVRLKSGLRPTVEEADRKKKDHIVIIGFGISGRNLAHSAKEGKIPYVILDMNAEVVKVEKQKGEPIHYGDATHESVLHHVNISDARVVAVVINDPVAAGRVVEIARRLNPRAYILVRTRYLREMKQMHGLGADEVIPDEYGSSVEIFTRVLRKYQIPTLEVEKIVSDMRVEGYEMMRLLFKEPTSLSDIQIALSDVAIETLRVELNSTLAGKTLAESDLRKNYGLTVMLIKRGNETIAQLDGQTRFMTDDVVVTVGTHDKIALASRLFKPQRAEVSLAPRPAEAG